MGEVLLFILAAVAGFSSGGGQSSISRLIITRRWCCTVLGVSTPLTASAFAARCDCFSAHGEGGKTHTRQCLRKRASPGRECATVLNWFRFSAQILVAFIFPRRNRGCDPPVKINERATIDEDSGDGREKAALILAAFASLC